MDDRGFRNPVLAGCLLVISIWLSLSSTAVVAESFAEGKDYQRLPREVPTHANGQIEVVEVFWYGCPHCRDFHPVLEKWKQTLADDVKVELLPSTGSDAAKAQAAAFYAAQAMKKLDAVHEPLFDALARDRERLHDEDALAEFVAGQGLDEDRFRKAFNSFGVKSKVKNAYKRAVSYQAFSVPTLIVAGKYRIDAGDAGSFSRMLKIADFLIAREREQVSGVQRSPAAAYSAAFLTN